MSSTVRRNPLGSLASRARQAATTVSKTVQKTATAVSKGAQKTAGAVQRTANKAATTVQRNAERAANTVSTKTKEAASAARDGLRHVRAETRKATESSNWKNWDSKFEAKGGKVTIGASKGFGDKMDSAPTLKEFKSKGTSRHTAEWTDKPSPSTFKDKAKSAGKEVVNSVGVKVFDPNKAKFEKDWDATSIKTKRVDSATVDKKGYDVGYRVLSAYAEGKGNITIGKTTNIEGKIDAGAVLTQGTVEGKAKLGRTGLEATGKAEATVGVTGSASGQVRFDVFSKTPTVKVKAGAEAFAGAKASVEGRIGNDYAGVGAKAEGWVGIGAKAKADIGIEGGKFKAKVELGAALGIGGSLSFSVDVNYQKAVDSVIGTGKKAVETLTNAGKAVADGARAAASAVANGASALASGAKSVVSAGWKKVSGWFGG
jgi:hypothetical protein